MSQTYEAVQLERINALEKKKTVLEREIKIEQDLFAQNNDPNSNSTYKYYSNELVLTSERKDKEIKALQDKSEVAIKAIEDQLKNTIKSLQDKAEVATKIIEDQLRVKIEAIESKANRIVNDFSGKMNEIVSNMGTPTSLSYRRKKQAIDELETIIEAKRSEWLRTCEADMLQRRKRAFEENMAIMRESNRQEALEAQRINDARLAEVAIIEEKKLARWREQGLETETAIITPVVEKKKKIPYTNQTIKKMTLEQMVATNLNTVPSDKLDEWEKRFDMLERKEEKKNSSKK